MAYIPNPTDVTQPTEDVLAQTAAAEFRALKQYVQTIVSGGGLGVATPGQIAMFAGVTALPGWLDLGGQELSRAVYPNLWAAAQALGNVVTEAAWFADSWGTYSSGDGVNTFRLPNWRGEFVRVWDNSRGIDPGRAPGVRQRSTSIGRYAHSDSVTPGALSGISLLIANAETQGLAAIAGANKDYYMNAAGNGGPNAVYADVFGTRPTNVSALYCVKT